MTAGSRVRMGARLARARVLRRQRLPARPRHLVRGRGQPGARVPRARELRLLRVASPMRVALAQLNPTVGDLAGNRRLVEEAAAKAASERADLLVAPEMVLTGYPPMDLLERDGFVRDQLRELDALAAVVAAGGDRARRRAAGRGRAARRVPQRVRAARGRAAAWPRARRPTCRPTTCSTSGAISRPPSGASRCRSATATRSWVSPSARTPGSSRRAMRWIRSASSRARAPTSCSIRRARRGTRTRRASGAA